MPEQAVPLHQQDKDFQSLARRYAELTARALLSEETVSHIGDDTGKLVAEAFRLHGPQVAAGLLVTFARVVNDSPHVSAAQRMSVQDLIRVCPLALSVRLSRAETKIITDTLEAEFSSTTSKNSLSQ